MTIRGSASISAEALPAYIPTAPAVSQADALAEQYKLGAAEAEYRKLLASPQTRAEALNGLGKITYYQTASPATWQRENKDAKIDAARRYFEEAVLFKPAYAEAWLNLADMLIEQKEVTLAQEALDKVSALEGLSPKLNARYNLSEGKLALERQEASAALPYLETSVQFNAKDDSARYYLAKAHIQRGEYQKAYDDLQAALHINPDNPKLYEELGILHDAMGNTTAARNAYEKALWLKPELRLANERLIWRYEQTGKAPMALSQLQRLMATSDQSQTLEQGRLALRAGELALESGQPELARRYFEFASQSPDAKLKSQAQRGISDAQTQSAKTLYTEAGYSSEAAYQAREKISAALMNNPDNFKAQQLRVELNARQASRAFKDVSFSQKDYQNVYNQTAASRGEMLARAEMLLDRYQFADASAQFEMLADSLTQSPDAIKMGDMLLTLGMPDLAKKAYQRAEYLSAKQGQPENPTLFMIAYDKVAKAQSEAAEKSALASYLIDKSRENPEIESLLLESLKRDQANFQTHYALARYYEKQKINAAALDHYFAFLQLAPNSQEREKVKVIKAMTRLKEKP
ncbi:MAG: tetratricopeptide repeat protein [Vampirovibrionales bacterium]|nr:tetratricopeptide repeat protein [Vampirovibrionales bacterium]